MMVLRKFIPSFPPSSARRGSYSATSGERTLKFMGTHIRRIADNEVKSRRLGGQGGKQIPLQKTDAVCEMMLCGVVPGHIQGFQADVRGQKTPMREFVCQDMAITPLPVPTSRMETALYCIAFASAAPCSTKISVSGLGISTWAIDTKREATRIPGCSVMYCRGSRRNRRLMSVAKA
jgi:hypothetical protein